MKLKKTHKILLAYFSKPYDCMDLDELEALTKIKRSELIVLLHLLYKKGLIRRYWRHYSTGKKRVYCLKKEKIMESFK